MVKIFKNKYKQGFTLTPFKKKGVSLETRRGFTRLVDFDDATLSRTKSASPKLTTGFTLVETMIALSIFTVSILGLMSVLSQGISDTTYAKRKNIATYLAQEGIEYIRNIRDTYVLYSASGPVGWDAFNTKMRESGAVCHQANGCYFDDQDLNYANQDQPITGIYMIECGSTCAPLLYDSTTGKYNYKSGVNSGFIRQIQVSLINANETKIFSTVYWTQGSGTFQITFSQNLFNWVE